MKDVVFSKDDTKVVKGIAILLMLYHHLFAFPTRVLSTIEYYSLFKINDLSISFIIGCFGKICVNMFAFLGGYAIYSLYKKEPLKNKKNFILKKIKFLYFEYWKVFLIFIPIYFIFFDLSFDFKELVLNFIGLSFSYNYEWWFFFPYIILIFLFPWIYKLFCFNIKYLLKDLLKLIISNVIIIVLKLFLIMFISSTGNHTSCILISLNNLFSILSLFLVGCFFAEHNLLSKLKYWFKNRYFLSYFLILLIICFRAILFDEYDFDCLYVPFFVLCIITIFDKNSFLKKIIHNIGCESTTMWLVHTFFCYRWFQKFIFYPRFSILIFILLVILSYYTSKILSVLYSFIFRRNN